MQEDNEQMKVRTHPQWHGMTLRSSLFNALANISSAPTRQVKILGSSTVLILAKPLEGHHCDTTETCADRHILRLERAQLEQRHFWFPAKELRHLLNQWTYKRNTSHIELKEKSMHYKSRERITTEAVQFSKWLTLCLLGLPAWRKCRHTPEEELCRPSSHHKG